MIVVIPTPADDPEPPAARALRTEGLWAITAVCADPFSYGRLVAALVGSGDDFVLVEHDVVPWPGAVRELMVCQHAEAACVFEYHNLGFRGGFGYSLGCSRFRDPGRLGLDLDEIAETPWQMVDTRLWEMAGHPPAHVHAPGVGHARRVPSLHS